MNPHLGITWRSLKAALVLTAAGGLFTACAAPRQAAQSGVQPSVTTAKAPQLTYTTSWIGNTWGQGPGAGTNTPQWMTQNIEDIYVAPNGTIYTNTSWDEEGAEVSVFNSAGDLTAMAKHTHNDGYFGGVAVTANANYVYIAQSVKVGDSGVGGENTWPTTGREWTGVSRRIIVDITVGASFTDGKGGAGNTLPGSFLVVNDLPEDPGPKPISGLAASATELFVSNLQTDQIRVYNAATMASVRNWTVTNPNKLAIDSLGFLWVLQTGTTPKILKYSNTGALQSAQITFTTGVIPTDIAIDNTGRLLVSDVGVDQNIKIYNASGLTGTKSAPDATFGTLMGLYSGTAGAYGSKKLFNVYGVGSDTAGNIYVGTRSFINTPHYNVININSRLEGYSSAGTLLWNAYAAEGSTTASMLPGSDTEIYSHHHYTVDFSKTTPGTEATLQSYTINLNKYPNDARISSDNPSGITWPRTINGKTILFSLSAWGNPIMIYRFNAATDGEIAIPSGVITGETYQYGTPAWPPNEPAGDNEWTWRHTNGNGQFDSGEYTTSSPSNPPGSGAIYIDPNATIWQAGAGWPAGDYKVRKRPCQGLDAVGNPIYDYALATIYSMPADVTWTGMGAVRYDIATDSLYIVGSSSMLAPSEQRLPTPSLLNHLRRNHRVLSSSSVSGFAEF